MFNQYNNPIPTNSNLYDYFTEDSIYQNELDIVESDTPDMVTLEESDNDEFIFGCGLTNMGNTCYMNAVIQGLANIESLATLINCKSVRNNQLVIENYFKKNNPNKCKEIEEYKNSKCFTIAFDKTIEILSSNQYNAITPTSIRKAVINTFPEFNNNRQQDAHEFLLAIMNILDDELTYNNIQIEIESDKYNKIYNDYINLQCNEKKTFFENLSDIDKDKLSGILSYINFNKTYSPIQEIFQFIIKSTITCSECSCCSTTFTPELIMALEIPEVEVDELDDSTTYYYNNFNTYSNFNYSYNGNNYNNNIYNGLLTTSDDDQEIEPDKSDSDQEIEPDKSDSDQEIKPDKSDSDQEEKKEEDDDDDLSIRKCLDQFFANETLTIDNHYFCNQCKKKVEANKQFVLTRLSPVIIFQFKRFKQQGTLLQKNTDDIDFPFSINLKKYTENKEDKIYELRSVIHHEGNSPQHGHYTTYIKSIDDKWLYCNDENVTIETNLDLIKDDDAYILIYEEIKK
jgi:ubiquitin C-terminal hydrolase